MKKIQKNDEVIVLVGKDKGKRGTVTGVVGASRLLISGVNMAKKAFKPNPVAGVTGGIAEVSMPIDASNVALFNAVTGKADRVGFRVVDGVKVRVYKSSGEVVRG